VQDRSVKRLDAPINTDSLPRQSADFLKSWRICNAVSLKWPIWPACLFADWAECSACRFEPIVREVGGVQATGCVGFPKGLEVAHKVVVRTVQGGCHREQTAGDLGHGPGEVASRCLSRIAHGLISRSVIKV